MVQLQKGNFQPKLRAAIAVLLLTVAIVVLGIQLRRIDPAEVLERVRELSPLRVSVAVVVTLANYAQLALYDFIGLQFIGRNLRARRVLLAGFCATVFAHNIGPSLVSGGSLRYRFYAGWGLKLAEVGKLVAFGAVTFLVGFSWAGGLTLATIVPSEAFDLAIPAEALRPIGFLLVGLGGAYLATCAIGPRRLRVRHWSMPVPSLRLALAQVAVAATDWFAMAAVLTLLMPANSVTYLTMLRVLVLSQILAMSSQVPGGVGVFESLMVASLTVSTPLSTVAATLVLYRVIYYLLPFGLAFVATTLFESRRGAIRSYWGNSRLKSKLAPRV